MSYLAEEFENLLKENKLRPADVARTSGITEAAISRLRSGAQSYMSSEYLEKIAAAIGSSPMIHARLLRARMLDDCSGPGRDYITIEIRGEKIPRLKEDGPAYAIKLPPKLDAAMRTIAQHLASDTELKNIILGLGNLYARGSVS